MSTHSLRKKLARYRSQTTKRRRALHAVRKFGPLAAMICVGAYLPPKVSAQGVTYQWQPDADGAWRNGLNWLPQEIPGIDINQPADVQFDLNFSLNRTIS